VPTCRNAAFQQHLPRPAPPSVFALWENLVIGSLRECAPRLLRTLLVVITVFGSTYGIAQESLIYEGTGTVVVSRNELGLLPFVANVGDQFRFRAVLDATTPPVPWELDPAVTTYDQPLRELSFWFNGVQVLTPTNVETNGVHIRNDYLEEDGVVVTDTFAFSWRKPLGNGRNLDFGFFLHDSVNHNLLESAALPISIDYTRAINQRSINFVIDIPHQVAIQITDFSVSRGSIDAPPPLSSIVPGPNPWLAAATASQVPNSRANGDDRRINAAFWVNPFGDVATLQFAEQGSAGVNRVTLRCAPAGATGPALWTADLSGGLSGRRFLLFARDLAALSPSAGCPTVINNIASLEAAAERRLLYIELERSGTPLRGQLWPRSFGLQAIGFGSMTMASDQQVVMASPQPARWLRTPITLWFSELTRTLADVGYSLPYRHRFRNVSLHCAPPGEDGAVVAQLLASEGVLTLADIVPVDAASPCGMAINNHASLLEALARGNLYAVVELADPAGVQLRGQFPAP